MKVTTHHATSLVSGNVESVEMTLTAKGIKAATRMFRDQIYTHKSWAVVREVICNAIDEHNKHAIKKPIKITLPTANDPHFRVRDFAKGLDKDGVFSVFFQYFASTKDQDNDSIGGFGIGAKSPLAYSEIFYVDSYHGGKKISYVANIDGEVSTAHNMSLEDSNETGIEVSVPIEQKDWNNFADLVQYFINYSNFQNFEFIGRTLAKQEQQFIVEIPEAKIGNCKMNFTSNSKIYAQIGDVVYPVDNSNEFSSPFHQNVILKLENGSVDISPSRERLDLSKRTTYAIKTKLEEVAKKIGENYVAELKKAKTAKEKFKIQGFSEIFRNRPANLNLEIPDYLIVHKNYHAILEWDNNEIEKTERKSAFSYGDMTASIDTEGKTKNNHSWRSTSNLLTNGGSILLTGDVTLYSHRIIAFAEKHKLQQPILCVKHDKIPNQWVKGVDIFVYDETSITEDELKAVRDRYIERLPTGQRVKAVKTKEDTILGYRNGSSSSYSDSVLVRNVSGSKNTYILVSKDDLSKYVPYYAMKNFLQDGEILLTCYKSNLESWNKFSKEAECPKFVYLDKFYDTLKKRMEDYIVSSKVDFKNGLARNFSTFCKDQSLKAKLQFANEDYKEEILRKHPEFSTIPNKTSPWLEIQKKWDSLPVEDREFLSLNYQTQGYFRPFPTLEKKAKTIWDKVFC